jgi:hypothetical protein
LENVTLPDSNQENFVGAISDGPGVGYRVSRILSVDRVDNDKIAKWMISHIFMDILRYLYNSGEGALANSIWHSIRMDCVRVEEGSDFIWSHSNTNGLPDDVADLLANKELMSNPWLTLQLDRNVRGTFSQVWMIERIMNTGVLWAGGYISTPEPNSDSNQEEADKEIPEPSSVPIPGKPPKTILESQSLKQVLAGVVKNNILREEKNLDSEQTLINIGALVNMMPWLSSGQGLKEQNTRLRRKVAAFDVDGPCLVVVPYDSDMERLPRPVVRCQAMAWIVQPVPRQQHEDRSNVEETASPEVHQPMEHLGSPPPEEDADEFIISAGEIDSDMLPSVKKDILKKVEADLVPEHASKRRKTSSEKGKGRMVEEEASTAAMGSGTTSTEQAAANVDDSTAKRKFSVLGRVRGVWEILEEPLNEYTFI